MPPGRRLRSVHVALASIKGGIAPPRDLIEETGPILRVFCHLDLCFPLCLLPASDKKWMIRDYKNSFPSVRMRTCDSRPFCGMRTDGPGTKSLAFKV